MIGRLIDEANQKAFHMILNGQPAIVGIDTANKVIPKMKKNTILHAGPPITWDKMTGPLRGAVIGALIYEGFASDRKEAETIASSDKINFEPCHHNNSVGPMAGVMSYSMPVWIIENTAYKNRAYCTLNEGLGKVLRYGAFSSEVIDRLRWMESILAPLLNEAIKLRGGIDLKPLIAQALQMGDECHNRNKAATSLLIKELAPYIVETNFDNSYKRDVLNFIHGNDHFFLNISMAACKSILDAVSYIKYSTIVTAQARNGTEFGIRVSGLGDRWFTAPAQRIDGLYFPGYSVEDANPDIGDSVITETCGIGGFAMAAAPAIVQFVGGTPKDAVNYTTSMYEITQGESNVFTIPFLNFRGTPTAIDIRKVVENQVLPIINTGIAHKEPGVGMVGAGLVRPPMECFEKALEAFVEQYVG